MDRRPGLPSPAYPVALESARWPGWMPSCRTDAKPLLVGQAAVFHLNHKVTYNTVFNPEMIELLATGKTLDEIHRASMSEN